MNQIQVIALTHEKCSTEVIGHFFIPSESRIASLTSLKNEFGFDELMYLATCNRIEFIFRSKEVAGERMLLQILHSLRPESSEHELAQLARSAKFYSGNNSVEHLLRVVSSLDSSVIGEREIITQFRKAFDECRAAGLCGDAMRLVAKQCIHTAKEIFTETDLAKKPVSVVSIAWHEFRKQDFPLQSGILLIGAGKTIASFAKFLFESGFTNITIANRTLFRAKELAARIGASAISLDELKSYTGGFDVMVSCTSSANPIIDTQLFSQILQGDLKKKTVIDLALPADVHSQVREKFNVHYVGMDNIRSVSDTNLKFREAALEQCKPIIENGLAEFEKMWQQRQVELAMQSIPEIIKEIKATALGEVFAKDLEQLDENSRDVLDRIMAYIEKKYISIPMKMAREVLIDAIQKN